MTLPNTGNQSILFFFGFLFVLIQAKEPSQIPGEEISEEKYLHFILPKDSVLRHLPNNSPESPTWLDLVQRTWNSPTFAEQVDQDKQELLMGMGALYIPYLSFEPLLEPDLHIRDAQGTIVYTGKPGKKYNLLPGSYTIYLGSGSENQKITKQVVVQEGKVTPIIPDWSGLIVEVVDENNQYLRANYEITRIDIFEPYGKGNGRNLNLGEELNTWILKPGVYKIFGVGESYNTMKNFVTVRLLPSELVHFIIAINKNDKKIIGGGEIHQSTRSEINSNWHYGIDVSGGVDINSANDNTSVSQNLSEMSTLLNMRLTYYKVPFKVENSLRFDEAVNLTDFSFSTLQSSVDEVRGNSLFTWEIYPWLGPYTRLEANTQIVPTRIERNSSHHMFIILGDSLTEKKIKTIDSTAAFYKLKPGFSPLNLESGFGANMQIVNSRYTDLRLLTGIGLTHKRWRKEFRKGSENDLPDSVGTTPKTQFLDTLKKKYSYTILFERHNEIRTEIGPEIIIDWILRLGKYTTTETEVKLLAPFTRIKKPDVELHTTVSWRLISSITVDYMYNYYFIQSVNQDLQQQKNSHRVLIRYSYSSK